jgi:hypothetical protein
MALTPGAAIMKLPLLMTYVSVSEGAERDAGTGMGERTLR